MPVLRCAQSTRLSKALGSAQVVGAICGPALGLLFPCLFDLVCVHRRAYDRTRLEVFASWAVVTFAVVALAAGCLQQVVWAWAVFSHVY